MRGLFTKISTLIIFVVFMLLIAAVMWLLVLGLQANAGEASFDPAKDVSAKLLASADGLPAGKSLDLAVVLRVPAGYHIASRESGNFTVDFDSVAGLTFGPVAFPQGRIWQEEEVFGPEVVVRSRVKAAANLEPGKKQVKALVVYQICTETGAYMCFAPVERQLTLDLNILFVEAAPKSLNEAVFGASVRQDKRPQDSTATIKSAARDSSAAVPDSAVAAVSQSTEEAAASAADRGLEGSLESALARGSLAALFLVFLGGILSSFTPCVYPIIPITISYIGARAGGRKLTGFFLSLVFVAGLAMMYSGLGIIAALTGGVFGSLTQNPIVYGVLIAIFLIMGASMMGAFDLQLPASWQGKLQSRKRSGLVGAFFMGAASGLIAAPCVGPILVVLLTWVGNTHSVLFGFGLLFSYALGMGMLFIVIGTFAGIVSTLPKAGGWMEGIKHLFGWIMWGTAVFFAQYILPQSWLPLLWGAFLLLLGTKTGAFKSSSDAQEWRGALEKWLGLLAVCGGIFFFLMGLSQLAGWPNLASSSPQLIAQTPEEPNWRIISELNASEANKAFADAAQQGQPIMMDFYADWCAACKELDHKTYNQPEIISRSQQFINVKMDFTRQGPWMKEMYKKYDIKGMPTVIFFNPTGEESERFSGFRIAPELALVMDRVIAGETAGK